MDSDEGSSESGFSPHELHEWDSDNEYAYDEGQPEDVSDAQQQDPVGERAENRSNWTVPTLLEIASERVAACHPFETVERFHRKVQPVPLDLQLDIMKRAFPRDESLIQTSAFLSWTSVTYGAFSNDFLKIANDDSLLIKDAVQIGFTLSGTVVHVPLFRKDRVRKATAYMEFDRQRITSASCSVHGRRHLWCKHVVRLAFHRLRYPSAVEYRLPVSYTLQNLDLDQHKQLIQTILSDQPLEFLSKAHKILDSLTDGDEAAGTAETICDRTAGAAVGEEAMWHVDETRIRQVIGNYCGYHQLLRGGRDCYLQDQVATDTFTETVKQLSTGGILVENDEVEEDQWNRLWEVDVYLQIVRRLLKRGDETAVKLLQLLTDQWLQMLEAVVKISNPCRREAANVADSAPNLTRNMELFSCTEKSCLPDRLIAYWRLAVLNPHYSKLFVSQVLEMHKGWANRLQRVVALADNQASRLRSASFGFYDMEYHNLKLQQLGVICSLMKWNGFCHIQVWASTAARRVIDRLTCPQQGDLLDPACSFFDCSKDVASTTSALAVVTCLARCMKFYDHVGRAVTIAVAALRWAFENAMSEPNRPYVPLSKRAKVKNLFIDFHDYLWGGSDVLFEVGLIAPVTSLMEFILDESEVWKGTADSPGPARHSTGAIGTSTSCLGLCVPVPMPLRLIVKYAALQDDDLFSTHQSFNSVTSTPNYSSSPVTHEPLLIEKGSQRLLTDRQMSQIVDCLRSPNPSKRQEVVSIIKKNPPLVTVLLKRNQERQQQRSFPLSVPSGSAHVPFPPAQQEQRVRLQSQDFPANYRVGGSPPRLFASPPPPPEQRLSEFRSLCPAVSCFSSRMSELSWSAQNKLITTAIEVVRNLDIPNIIEWLVSTGSDYLEKSPSEKANLGRLLHLILGVTNSLHSQSSGESLLPLVVAGMKQHARVLASLVTSQGCDDTFQYVAAEHASLLLLSLQSFGDNEAASMIILQQAVDSIASLIQMPSNGAQSNVDESVQSLRLSTHVQIVGCVIDLMLDDDHFEVCHLVQQLNQLHLPVTVDGREPAMDMQVGLLYGRRKLRRKIGMWLLLKLFPLGYPSIGAFSVGRLRTSLLRAMPMVAGELDGEVLVSLLSLVNLESCLSGPDLLNYVILNEPFITALSAHIAAFGFVPASFYSIISASALGVDSERECQEFLSAVRRLGPHVELFVVKTVSTLSERQICHWSFNLLVYLSKFDTGTLVQQLNIAVAAYKRLFLSVKADEGTLRKLLESRNCLYQLEDGIFPSFLHHLSSMAVQIDRLTPSSGSSVDGILDLLQNIWIDPQISFHVVAEMARIYKSEEMSKLPQFQPLLPGNDTDDRLLGAASWPEPADALKLLYEKIPRSAEIIERCKRNLIAIITGRFGDGSGMLYRSRPLPGDLICLHVILQSHSDGIMIMRDVVKSCKVFWQTLGDTVVAAYKTRLQRCYDEDSIMLRYSDCRHYFYRSICGL